MLSVNGNRVSDAVQPGTFAASGAPGKMAIASNSNSPCRFGWKPWMQIIRSFVALMQGPLVLFAVADSQPSFDRNALAASQACKQRHRRLARNSADGSSVTMRPFMNIDKESYSTYVVLKS